MSHTTMYGWDMTFANVQKNIRRKSDVIIAFVHWNLTKRGFRVTGVGEEATSTADAEGSEVLPTGWNDQDNYALRYILDNKIYMLHGLLTDCNLIINLIRSQDLAVSNIAVNVEDVVKQTNGTIETMMPTHRELMSNLKRSLIDEITDRPTTTTETQTNTSNQTNQRLIDDPLRITPRPIPRPGSPTIPDLWAGPEANPFNIGRSDLNPFGVGGGMLFQPFGPGRRGPENPGFGIPGGLPRGAVPPGARFDPFAPPGAPGPRANPRPPPDADHLPPPGFDDMFS